jgi:hypothetical protein
MKDKAKSPAKQFGGKSAKERTMEKSQQKKLAKWCQFDGIKKLPSEDYDEKLQKCERPLILNFL